MQLDIEMALKLEHIKVQQNICIISLCSVSFTSIQLQASKMRVELEIGGLKSVISSYEIFCLGHIY